jgi:hypothetical protein
VPIRQAADSLIDLRDAVELYAELSLALAGFAGVVTAFAGRQRAFRPIERMRLEGIVSLAASVLGSSLSYLSAAIAGLSAVSAESVAGCVGLALHVPVGRLMPRLWRRARDADATVDPWSLYMVTVAFAIEVLLLSTAALGFGRGWQLAVTYSIQLLQGLWLFFLLLTREN